jgi:hypothetical protein
VLPPASRRWRLVGVLAYAASVALIAAVPLDDNTQIAVWLGGGLVAGLLVGRPWVVTLAALWLVPVTAAELTGTEYPSSDVSPWLFTLIFVVPISIACLAVGAAAGFALRRGGGGSRASRGGGSAA